MKIKFLLFLSFIVNLKCSSNYIENCSDLDKNDYSIFCKKCKENYFLFFDGLYCLPCNNSYYGQVGCQGNCDSSRYKNDRFVYCNENQCKEGFYYLNGLCFDCDKGSPGCKKCIVIETQSDNGKKDYNYICQQCISNEYRLDNFGTCEKCKISHCLKCEFSNDNSSQKCIQCESNYYLSEDGTCKSCEVKSIDYGYCTDCSDNKSNLSSCYCYNNYGINKNKSCSPCNEGCNLCIIDENNLPYCLECNSGTFKNQNECLKCSSGCNTCIIGDQGQNICTACDSQYALFNGNCKECIRGCNNCIIKDDNNTSCLSCQYDYAYNPNIKNCTRCSSINYIGGYGCERCRFNNITNNYECLECYYYYSNNKYIQNYAYIKNKFQCLSNTNKNENYLFGCLEANYIEDNKYECLKCKEGFIQIINDLSCREISEIDLSNFCLEVINIGNITNPIYSCNKCNNENALITDINNISNCYERKDNLVYCVKGEIDNNNKKKCIECVSFAHLNESQICECNEDSFGSRNIACYKCDDEIKGNPGCIASEGCEYRIINDQLNCNKCKNDFYEYTKGQCFSCSNELQFCNKCKLDSSDQFICEECIENFSFNRLEGECQLNCEEYSNISPGCVICKEEYKFKRKCQACKSGYFKTKDQECVYCRSKKYGGPECNKCGYDENEEKIICVNCIESYQALNSKGKCYNCKDELFNECQQCKFIQNGNEEQLICTFCIKGYYLDENGNCINFSKYLEKKPNCNTHCYKIDSFELCYYDDYIYYSFYYNSSYYYYSYSDYYYTLYDENIENFINNYLRQINGIIKGYCNYCNDGFYLNSNEECIKLTNENCSIISMLKNNFYYYCNRFCKINQYPLVVLKLNDKYKGNSYITISGIYNNFIYSEITNEIKSLKNQKLCINNSENNNLKNCIIVIYINEEDKYICHVCKEGYFLDKETNICLELDKKMNCEYENIGNITNPIYSCTKCIQTYYYYDYYNRYYYDYHYNESSYYRNEYSSNYIMVKEGNISFCIRPDSNLDYCLSANANTTYVNTKYDCTNCIINHLPYESKFYERKICQNILEKIKYSQNKTFSVYHGKIMARDGECENNTLFTPDGIYCYKCDNQYIGMYGCKSECSFSLKKNKTLKCLDGCKEGYIESSEGICESCYKVNEGCNYCHYENEYPSNYLGFKRQRRFICDECSPNYIKKDEECISCNNLINGCQNCKNENNKYKCNLCFNGYYLNEDYLCTYCQYGFVLEGKKCINCNDISQGGIEGCLYCNKNGNLISCSNCEEGYILLSSNKTCIKISQNKELKKLSKCRELAINNNHFDCLSCKSSYYSLLKENNKKICIYAPEINGYIDDSYDYDFSNIYAYGKNPSIDYIYKYYYNKYISYYFYGCLEVINLGTQDNPLYSCIRCSSSSYLLLTEENSNISYCIYYNKIVNDIVN